MNAFFKLRCHIDWHQSNNWLYVWPYLLAWWWACPVPCFLSGLHRTPYPTHRTLRQHTWFHKTPRKINMWALIYIIYIISTYKCIIRVLRYISSNWRLSIVTMVEKWHSRLTVEVQAASAQTPQPLNGRRIRIVQQLNLQLAPLRIRLGGLQCITIKTHWFEVT